MDDIVNAVDSGPIGKIKTTSSSLEKIVQIFQYIITLSPLLFLANSGVTNSGAVQDQITEKRNLSKARVGEYLALFATIPLMISHFQSEAGKVLTPLNLLKAKIQFIKNEVIKLRLFLASLYLTYEQRCDSFSNGDDNGNNNGNNNGELSDLNKLLQLFEEQYNDVFQQLSQSSNLIALQRIYSINDNLEKDYDISFKTINPSLGEGSEYPGTSPQLPD